MVPSWSHGPVASRGNGHGHERKGWVLYWLYWCLNATSLQHLWQPCELSNVVLYFHMQVLHLELFRCFSSHLDHLVCSLASTLQNARRATLVILSDKQQWLGWRKAQPDAVRWFVAVLWSMSQLMHPPSICDIYIYIYTIYIYIQYIICTSILKYHETSLRCTLESKRILVVSSQLSFSGYVVKSVNGTDVRSQGPNL